MWQRMPRTASIWLGGTVVLTTLLLAVAWWNRHATAWQWIAVGVGVSLATLAASKATVAMSGLADQPLQRMFIETSVRLALPLSVLLAVAVVRRDLLSDTFLLYFLPFQFLTIVADTSGSLKRVAASQDGKPGTDARQEELNHRERGEV